MGEGYPLHTKHESKEAPEFKASLGFDYIFHTDEEGVKRPYCIEINGDNAGIGGIQDIPGGTIDSAHKVSASIRNTYTPEFEHRYALAGELLEELKDGTFPISDENKEKVTDFVLSSLNRGRHFTHAHENPPFITSITNNKSKQESFIPRAYAARVYKRGDTRYSSTGFWMYKPNAGAGGVDVNMISNEHMLRYSDQEIRTHMAEGIFQEFIEPDGPEAAPEMNDHPASLRLLIDFKFKEDGTITIEFETAYQRVSPLPRNAPATHSYNDVYVVNKELDASSVAASEREYQLAHAATLEIIQNLGAAYKEQNLHSMV